MSLVSFTVPVTPVPPVKPKSGGRRSALRRHSAWPSQNTRLPPFLWWTEYSWPHGGLLGNAQAVYVGFPFTGVAVAQGRSHAYSQRKRSSWKRMISEDLRIRARRLPTTAALVM